MNIATPPAMPSTTAIHSQGSFQSIFHSTADDLAPAED
jgi:hypothetical protein